MATDIDLMLVQDALRRVPFLAGAEPDRTSLFRLAGLTNRVYRLDAFGEKFCIRLPGKGTEAYIDRKVEAVNARAAAAAGVSPAVLFFDEASGLMVTRFLDGVTTMTPERLRTTEGAPARAARALRTLHVSGQAFAFRFELFAKIDEYLKVLAGLEGVELPKGYHEVVKEAGAVRDALDAHPVPLAPCHCDPLCENFLDAGLRMWIVDWEYSGMNDPMWDLGDLSVEAGFGPDHDRELLEAYFEGPATPFDHGRMVIYKAMCDLLWTLWGLIQHANRNPADDFQAYATTRFTRCKSLMADASFPRHLAAIAAGPNGAAAPSARAPDPDPVASLSGLIVRGRKPEGQAR